MLKFASLGSGSSGNGTLVSSDSVAILLDCGFSVKETSRRLARLSLALDQLSAIVVTHEHSDHVKGVPALARKLGIPVYMTRGTYLCRDYGHIPNLQLIEDYALFNVGDIKVQPVPVPHDAREPAQYIFRHEQLKLGILTDLGSVTAHIAEAYQDCHGLLVEANHDPIMLAQGPYPPTLKERVAGPWGHLSNQQTVGLLEQLNTSALQHLVIGHISQQNNCIDLAQRALSTLDLPSRHIAYACQEQGFDWLYLN